MSDDTPISIDDLEKDESTIRDRVMDELCKRQKNFERNRGPQRWNVVDIWQSSFPAFTGRKYIDRFIEKYRNYSEFFDIDSRDTVGLTDLGRTYCRDLERG
jgi:hypothetical protein